MNWPYLGLAAYLPLILALGASLLCGILVSLRLHHLGGSSRAALRRLLLSLGLAFPLAFLLCALWTERRTVRGILGAATGQVADQRSMGILRAYGQGFLAVDRVKAAGWYRKAAEGGDAEAQVLLARCLAEGIGVQKDLAGALHWAETAAAQGDPQALLLAGDLHAAASPGTADARYRQALQALRAQARNGDAEAALACGLIYLRGKGVPRDPVEGLAWLLLAEQLGLHPMRVLAVKSEDAKATPDQRTKARLRMQALRLPAEGPPSRNSVLPS